jgi:hypothetical protein
LHLDEDSEFIYPTYGILSTVEGFIVNLIPSGEIPAISEAPAAPDFRRMRTALSTFQSRLLIKRSGLT